MTCASCEEGNHQRCTNKNCDCCGGKPPQAEPKPKKKKPMKMIKYKGATYKQAADLEKKRESAKKKQIMYLTQAGIVLRKAHREDPYGINPKDYDQIAAILRDVNQLLANITGKASGL